LTVLRRRLQVPEEFDKQLSAFVEKYKATKEAEAIQDEAARQWLVDREQRVADVVSRTLRPAMDDLKRKLESEGFSVRIDEPLLDLDGTPRPLSIGIWASLPGSADSGVLLSFWPDVAGEGMRVLESLDGLPPVHENGMRPCSLEELRADNFVGERLLKLLELKAFGVESKPLKR
jgi:hypothetical protein